MVFLITAKKLPPESVVQKLTLQKRTWENGGVKVTPIDIEFAVIHGITVLKVPPGSKAWCSTLVTEALLRLALFHIRKHKKAILQVRR